MKKTLLLQTALVAAAGLFVADIASAQTKAEPIGVSVGGYMMRAFKVQDRDKETGNAQVDRSSSTFGGPDTEIWFNIRAVLDNGLKVGGRIELEGATDSDIIDESYMWFENDSFGRAEIGSTDRVSGKMIYGAPTAIPGQGAAASASEISAIISPAANRAGGTSMWFANNAHDTEGLNLYTASNRYFGSKAGKGLQVAYSFVPDGCQDYANTSGGLGGAGTNTCANGFGSTTNAGQVKNNHQVAANYIETFGSVNLGIYAAYVNTRLENVPTVTAPITSNGVRDSLAGWQGGAQLTYNVGDGSTVTFGGAYKSEEVLSNVDRKAYNLGLRYLTNGAAPGSIGIGVEYFNSKGEETGFADDKYSLIQGGLTYQLAAGILLYGGIGGYKYEDGNDTKAAESQATFGVLGARLDF